MCGCLSQVTVGWRRNFLICCVYLLLILLILIALRKQDYHIKQVLIYNSVATWQRGNPWCRCLGRLLFRRNIGTPMLCRPSHMPDVAQRPSSDELRIVAASCRNRPERRFTPQRIVAADCPANDSGWLSTAATPRAPAGSTASARCSRIRRIAWSIWSSLTASTESYLSCSIVKASGTGTRTATPSAIVAAVFVSTTIPCSSESFIEGARSATTATILVFGDWCRRAAPTPANSAPLPSGTRTEFRSGTARASSKPMMPAPSAMEGSAPSSTKRACISRA